MMQIEQPLNHLSSCLVIQNHSNKTLKMSLKKSITKYFTTGRKSSLGSSSSSIAKSLHLDNSNNNEKPAINKLPYDVLSTVLGLVHSNRVVSQAFIDVCLVCRHWRTLSRINGQKFDINSFFVRNESLKMKGELIERCLGYVAYMYPSVDSIQLGRLSLTDSAINLKYTMLYLDRIDRVSQLDIDLNKVDSRDFSLLVQALRSKRSLKHVTIHNASAEHIYHIIDLLEHTHAIASLTLVNASLDNREEALRLHDFFVDNTSLTSVRMTFTGAQTIETFKEVLAVNPNLTELRLRCLSNEYSNLKTFSRFDYPHLTQKLSVLALPHCGLINKDFEELSSILASNNSLVELDLSDNPLVDPPSVANLLTSLANNAASLALSSLSLGGLQMDDDSVHILSRFIQHNQTLYFLDVSECPMRWDAGFQALLVSIIPSKLVRLALNRANLSSRAFGSLSDMIKQSQSRISTLSLAGTLNSQTGNHLGYALAANTTLTSLDISNCELHQQGGGSICISLQTNSTLVSLNLANTKLHSFNILLVADSLKKNRSLTALDALSIANQNHQQLLRNTSSDQIQIASSSASSASSSSASSTPNPSPPSSPESNSFLTNQVSSPNSPTLVSSINTNNNITIMSNLRNLKYNQCVYH
ncbi:leucine-rich repeat-containing protein [Cavenderia fasciculata]|uniref:Leucine-rich repeat-containing protein n=1 Tax=Cavenderia fasciculata TaxID=261658 RepID=F4QF11_CACFS|nr:leucine-rich repeat-containing protein [Cavenderia fasciculata]EGG13370.1 leucine-rich repeat-containing protein [Cavenderia fasciculata]|eukprot:XP_004350074.1 leucine-rich repeat-containing protein [Cavenderia fasciculata]